MFAFDLRRAIAPLVLPLLAAGVLWAQGEAVNARLSGTVFDPENAVVAGATVTLSDAAKGWKRQVVTSDDGRYTLTLVPPSAYVLTVEKTGFSMYRQAGIVLAVGQSATVNPKLELGRVDQVIEVNADAPLLNTENANIGSEVSGKQVVELPLNLRNVFNLVLLSSSVNNSIQYQGLT